MTNKLMTPRVTVTARALSRKRSGPCCSTAEPRHILLPLLSFYFKLLFPVGWILRLTRSSPCRNAMSGFPLTCPRSFLGDIFSAILPRMVYYASDCLPQLAPFSVETQRGGGEIGRRTSLRC